MGDFEHMAGQNNAKTQQNHNPRGRGPGAPGAPPEAAPLCFFAVVSHRFGRPRARNPLWRVVAPP
eukprot:1628267-Heterocapsa_arctica.AAC.1